MNVLNSIFILVLAFLAVFMEASFGTFRRLLAVQVDIIPGLMAYASLSAGIPTVCLLAVLGGLWFDALSANQLGVSILPLFVIGFAVRQFSHLILREQAYAQLILGFSASGFAPLLTLIILFSCGEEPLIGIGFVWQWLVMTLIGGLLVPLYFRLFHKVYRTLGYERIAETSFRDDREIKRGR